MSALGAVPTRIAAEVEKFFVDDSGAVQSEKGLPVAWAAAVVAGAAVVLGLPTKAHAGNCDGLPYSHGACTSWGCNYDYRAYCGANQYHQSRYCWYDTTYPYYCGDENPGECECVIEVSGDCSCVG